MERRTWSPIDDRWYADVPVSTAAGRKVTTEGALTFSAVWACVKCLSETISTLPLIVYRRIGEEGKQRALRNPLYKLLHGSPNSELQLTAKQWKSTTVVGMALWGNAYSFIERTPVGVKALWPLRPDHMTPYIDDRQQLKYMYRSGAATRFFDPIDVLHPRLFSVDGIQGLSPVTQAREAVGLGLGAEEYGARLFQSNAQMGGVLQHPGQLSDPARKNLQKDLDKKTGSSRAWQTLILEEGMKWQQITMPAQDAQWLGNRKFQINEVARFFAIPPHRIGDLERATFSNIEHMAIEFVQYSLMPWLVELEQEITLKLIPLALREKYFAEFKVEGLLRGDIKTRYDALAVARGNGVINANQWRGMENMNPLDEDEGGADYWRPANMIVVGAEPPSVPGAAAAPVEPEEVIELEEIEDEEPPAAARGGPGSGNIGHKG